MVIIFFQVDLTENGKQMLKNFLFDICGLSESFTLEKREQQCIKYIKKTVGDRKVLVSCKIYFSFSFIMLKIFSIKVLLLFALML